MLAMDITRSQHLIETLEADPAKLPAFLIDLERIIAWCMDEIFRLAKSGEDEERRMVCGRTQFVDRAGGT